MAMSDSDADHRRQLRRAVVASIVGTTVTPNISNGMKSVMITKERERTRSRYSRLAIMNVLCIVFSHRVDEYFFQ